MRLRFASDYGSGDELTIGQISTIASSVRVRFCAVSPAILVARFYLLCYGVAFLFFLPFLRAIGLTHYFSTVSGTPYLPNFSSVAREVNGDVRNS